MVDADFNFKMPKIEMTEKSEDGKYGKFVVEPLERGYGLTLGNSLRRIMLSSLVIVSSIVSLLSAPLRCAITRSGLIISISGST